MDIKLLALDWLKNRYGGPEKRRIVVNLPADVRDLLREAGALYGLKAHDIVSDALTALFMDEGAFYNACLSGYIDYEEDDKKAVMLSVPSRLHEQLLDFANYRGLTMTEAYQQVLAIWCKALIEIKPDAER